MSMAFKDIFGIGRLQSLVEFQGILQSRLDTQQRLWGHPRGEDELETVRGRIEHGAQRLVEFPVLDRLSFRVDQILEVVQENDGSATRKFSQQGLHLRLAALLGVLVKLVEVLRRLLRHRACRGHENRFGKFTGWPERALR